MVKLGRRPKALVYVPLIMVLLFIIGCGTAAPESQPAQDTQPAQSSQPATDSSKPLEVVRPAATAQAQPTPLPVSEVFPGKINVLIGGFGNESFIARYCIGLCHQYGRLLHAYLATTTHKGGVIPEALERWEINEDGTVWTLHMREGIKFHDGSEATIEDLLFSLDRMTDFEDENPRQTSTTQAAQRRQIKSQEITGPYEITVTMGFVA